MVYWYLVLIHSGPRGKQKCWLKIYNISLNKESWHQLAFGLAGVGRGFVRHRGDILPLVQHLGIGG